VKNERRNLSRFVKRTKDEMEYARASAILMRSKGMKVTGKMSMRDYDTYARRRLKEKVPEMRSSDRRRWLGDSIYNFVALPPALRESVHTEENRETDLGRDVRLAFHPRLLRGQARPTTQ
jgi:hypothetical protein